MRAMQVTQVAEPFKAILDRAARCEFSVTELRDRLSALDRFKFQMLDFYREAKCNVVEVLPHWCADPTAHDGKRVFRARFAPQEDGAIHWPRDFTPLTRGFR
jgi:hypothetical protein